MKAIIINNVCGFGSTGKLAYGLYRFLTLSGDDSLVLYGSKKSCNDKNCFNFYNFVGQKTHSLLGRLTGLNGCFSSHSTNKIIHKISSFQPDVVYLGNLHGYFLNIYKLYRFLKKENIPTIQIMWDEYPMTGSCAFSFDCQRFQARCGKCPNKKSYPISWFFDTSHLLQDKKKASYKMKNLAFVAVPYTARRAKKSFLLSDQNIFELDEAVDQTNIYYPRETVQLRKKLKIPENNKIILDVCVYPNHRKGGEYFIDAAKRCLFDKTITFVHVGFNGEKSDCPSNYLPIPFEKDQDQMALFYSLADLFVCTSLAETQPNTCLEALSCGTPICGFNISGIPTCAEPPFGQFVTPKSGEALKDVILKTPKKTSSIIRNTSLYAKSRFSLDNYCKNLRNIGIEMIASKIKTK